MSYCHTKNIVKLDFSVHYYMFQFNTDTQNTTIVVTSLRV